MRRLVLLFIVLLVTACDGYVERVTILPDGTVALDGRARVVCGDELAKALVAAENDACDVIDRLEVDGLETVNTTFLPSELEDMTFEVTGSDDRRQVDFEWVGDPALLVSGIVVSAEITPLTETTTEVVTHPELAKNWPSFQERRIARWPSPEFRLVSPHLIVEHNGDEIDGREVIWYLDDDWPEEFRLVWSTDERGFRVWWWLIGGSILTAVLFMMVVLEGRRPTSGSRHDQPGEIDG